MAAQINEVEAGEVVLEVVEQLEESVTEGPQLQVYRAAQTCLIAHLLVRRGRPPWGIQNKLDRDDMLALNSALAEILVLIASAFSEEAMVEVFVVLLDEARHILACQAQAHEVTVERLVEDYFVALSTKEAMASST